MATASEAPAWAHVDLDTCPHMVVPPPGPKSRAMHERCARHFKGLWFLWVHCDRLHRVKYLFFSKGRHFTLWLWMPGQ